MSLSKVGIEPAQSNDLLHEWISLGEVISNAIFLSLHHFSFRAIPEGFFPSTARFAAGSRREGGDSRIANFCNATEF